MLLSARGITKHYGRNTVLRDATFTVREHEILGLIGPNGAGKTTLFECLAGLIPMDAGALRLEPAIPRKQALFYMPAPGPTRPSPGRSHFFKTSTRAPAATPARSPRRCT